MRNIVLKNNTQLLRRTIPCEIIDYEKDEIKDIDDFNAFDTKKLEEMIQNKSNITAWLATFSAECIAIAKDNAVNNPGCNVNRIIR